MQLPNINNFFGIIKRSYGVEFIMKKNGFNSNKYGGYNYTVRILIKAYYHYYHNIINHKHSLYYKDIVVTVHKNCSGT